MWVCSITHSCLTLCNTMDCGPPGSSVHGIFQARILEQAAIYYSGGSSQPRDQTCLLLRCDGNTGNSFPTTQGKDTSSRAWRQKRGSSGCGQDSRASSRVETGMSGNFLSCSNVWRTLWKFQILDVISLKTPQLKWASSRLEGRTSWIFSSCGRCSRLTTGTSGTLSGGLRKG